MSRPLLVLALLFLTACNGGSTTPGTNPNETGAVVRFSPADAVLHVTVADTQEERARGLMEVTSLPSDEGMAFVWDAPTTGLFWMKDTLIPLSIAFVDQDGRILTIREMTPCEQDPCRTYGADGPYVLAVEANAGWFDAHGIGPGDSAALRNPA